MLVIRKGPSPLFFASDATRDSAARCAAIFFGNSGLPASSLYKL